MTDKKQDFRSDLIMGLLIAIIIFVLWTVNLIYSMACISINFQSPLLYLHLVLQIYLYTGLFITAHDAMHGTVHHNKRINNLTGWAALFLFAGMSFKHVRYSHFKHHRSPGDKEDPDFNAATQNFWRWWLSFIIEYLTWKQMLIMALAFNLLKIWFKESALIIFWVIPAILSTFQLFYFGTFLPHRYPHKEEMLPHNSRSQKKNHIWAMISCYFFGYHYEHHESPKTPWWRLYQLKK